MFYDDLNWLSPKDLTAFLEVGPPAMFAVSDQAPFNLSGVYTYYVRMEGDSFNPIVSSQYFTINITITCTPKINTDSYSS